MSAPINEWMPLNPDYRKDPPRAHDSKGNFIGYKPHCCRCQKAMVDQKGINHTVVEVDENMRVRITPTGHDLIGADCLKKVLSEYSKQ